MEKSSVINLTDLVDLDCCSLIDNFCSIGSCRFTDFAQCWRQKMFSHILSGRFQWNEIIEYIEMLLSICTQFLVADTSRIERRIGAIYLCYGVYNKLPPLTRQQCGLRLTRADWKSVCELKKAIKAGQHHDAHYCLQYLFEQGAFLFVATSRQMAPDLLINKLKHGQVGPLTDGCCCDNRTAGTSGDSAATLSGNQPAVVSCSDALRERFDQMHVLQRKYTDIKSTLFPAGSGNQLSMINSDTLRRISKLLGHSLSADESESTDDSSDQSEEDIGADRRSIRDRAVSRFRPENSLPDRRSLNLN